MYWNCKYKPTATPTSKTCRSSFFFDCTERSMVNSITLHSVRPIYAPIPKHLCSALRTIEYAIVCKYLVLLWLLRGLYVVNLEFLAESFKLYWKMSQICWHFDEEKTNSFHSIECSDDGVNLTKVFQSNTKATLLVFHTKTKNIVVLRHN